MREPQQPVTKTEQSEGGILYDFGKETFGFITLKNLSGKGKIEIYMVKARKKQKIKHIAKHWTNSCSNRDK
jgi:Holliday junction resolvase-like predicted endonuclease